MIAKINKTIPFVLQRGFAFNVADILTSNKAHQKPLIFSTAHLSIFIPAVVISCKED